HPIVGLTTFGIVLLVYFGKVKFRLGIPGGLVAVAVGTALAWTTHTGITPAPTEKIAFHAPLPVGADLIDAFRSGYLLKYLSVIVPMGVFTLVGSLQNIEAAEAAGDSYPTAPSLVANGLGTMAAALFGSCFPTTIYIGHPGWKALGARAGYSILNGVFFVIVALFGLSRAISTVMPIEAGMAIVLWIGIVITAQSFAATPRRHAPAVALGLFPAIAGWGVLILTQTLGAANFATNNMGLADSILAQPAAFESAGLHLGGMIALSQGFVLTCLIWSAASAWLIDRRFSAATKIMLIGAAVAFFGFIHAGRLPSAGGLYDIGWAKGWTWAIGYLLAAAFFAATGVWVRKSGQSTAPPTDPLEGHG